VITDYPAVSCGQGFPDYLAALILTLASKALVANRDYADTKHSPIFEHLILPQIGLIIKLALSGDFLPGVLTKMGFCGVKWYKVVNSGVYWGSCNVLW
jgi:hypothetical protein